jgi:hypothetical protein
MSDVQLYLAIGIPMIAVLASLTVSLVHTSAIRRDIPELRSGASGETSTTCRPALSIRDDVNGQISAIRDEVREIRSDIREIRLDIRLLNGMVDELIADKG